MRTFEDSRGAFPRQFEDDEPPVAAAQGRELRALFHELGVRAWLFVSRDECRRTTRRP